MRNAERPESRRVRAAAGAGLTLALAGVYTSLLVYAADGANLRVDYSYFKTSRPSDSTRKIAASLSEPIQVVAFYPDVNEVRTEVAKYLQDVASGIPKLQVRVVDRLLEPKLAKDMPRHPRRRDRSCPRFRHAPAHCWYRNGACARQAENPGQRISRSSS